MLIPVCEDHRLECWRISEEDDGDKCETAADHEFDRAIPLVQLLPNRRKGLIKQAVGSSESDWGSITRKSDTAKVNGTCSRDI